MKSWLIIAAIYTTLVVLKFRAERNDLCDTNAVLYRLSYQAIWELVTLWIRNIPVEGEECNEYMKGDIFELGKKMWIYDWSSQLYTQLKQLWN